MKSRRSRNYIRLFVKGFIFLVLLFFFLHFYFFQEFKDYLDAKTTFFASIEKRSQIKLPHIIVCTGPQIKILPEYNVHNSSFYQSVIPSAAKYNLTMKQLFEKLTYIPNTDYDIYQNGQKLQLGKNILGEFYYTEIQMILSFGGICSLITTNATQKSFGSLELFTKSKNPSLFFVRFVDSNYWHEIVYYEWKYFVPIQHLLYVYQTQSIKYRFSIGNNVKLLIFCHISSTFLIGLKETDMLEGIENREECMNKLLKQSNCSETCAPLVFNFLKFEQCKEPEDYLCMWNHSKSVKQEMYETCFQNSFITQYPSKFLRGASGVAKPYFGSVAISFDYISPRVELSTERYIIGVTDFIGSVGGSLGLFLGFSIFTYTSDMIDGILQKFKV